MVGPIFFSLSPASRVPIIPNSSIRELLPKFHYHETRFTWSFSGAIWYPRSRAASPLWARFSTTLQALVLSITLEITSSGYLHQTLLVEYFSRWSAWDLHLCSSTTWSRSPTFSTNMLQLLIHQAHLPSIFLVPRQCGSWMQRSFLVFQRVQSTLALHKLILYNYINETHYKSLSWHVTYTHHHSINTCHISTQIHFLHIIYHIILCSTQTLKWLISLI
jgi:hypothetical protein